MLERFIGSVNVALREYVLAVAVTEEPDVWFTKPNGSVWPVGFPYVGVAVDEERSRDCSYL